MPQPTRIIDSHQHVFWHNRDDKGLVQDMDEHGIETAWLLTWEIPPVIALRRMSWLPRIISPNWACTC